MPQHGHHGVEVKASIASRCQPPAAKQPSWRRLAQAEAISRDVFNDHLALIDDGGEITLGRVSGIVCVASAAHGHNALAMLAKRDDETLNALIKRLDKAIARHDE